MGVRPVLSRQQRRGPAGRVPAAPRALAFAALGAVLVAGACSNDPATGGSASTAGGGAGGGGAGPTITPPVVECPIETELVVLGPDPVPFDLVAPDAYAVVVGPEADLVVTDAAVTVDDILAGVEPVLAEGETWIELSLIDDGSDALETGMYEYGDDDGLVTQIVAEARVLVGDVDGAVETPVDGYAEVQIDELTDGEVCATIYLETGAGDATVAVEGSIVAQRLS